MTAAVVDVTDSIGWRLALAERQRQVDVEGWTDERDDHYIRRELYTAAQCYRNATGVGAFMPASWPWTAAAWKPRGRVDNLTRATALLIAEAERLQRGRQPAAAARALTEARALAEGLTNLVVARLRATVPTTPGGTA